MTNKPVPLTDDHWKALDMCLARMSWNDVVDFRQKVNDRQADLLRRGKRDIFPVGSSVAFWSVKRKAFVYGTLESYGPKYYKVRETGTNGPSGMWRVGPANLRSATPPGSILKTPDAR
jgi:hypothetical protein